MDGITALRHLKEALGGRNQAQLAIDVGVSEATISRWLAAQSPPKKGLSRLVEWAERRERAAQVSGHVSFGIGSTGRLDSLTRQTTPVSSAADSMRAVSDVVLEGQRELATWAQGFAARLLRASAAGLEALPLPAEFAGLPEAEAEADAADEATQRGEEPARQQRKARG